MSTTVANALSSRSATATPVKAITSTIASRSTPSLPPASQAYEPLVKSLFRHRLKLTLLLSAQAVWVINTAWAWWQVGGNHIVGFWGTISFPFSPSILFMTFLSWTTVALPAIVLRKIFLTPRRSGAASPLSMVKNALTQSSTRIALITYLFSTMASLTIHVMMAYKYEVDASQDPRLSLFVKSKKHPHYLNGRLVFLFFTQFFTAGAFALRGAMIDRFAYRWSFALNTRHSSRYLTILAAFAVSFVFSSLALLFAAIVFASARISLPVLYRIPLLSLVLRPFTAHFLKGRWTVLLPFSHLSLLFRAWFLAFSTFLDWEITDSLFEYVVSETASVSTFSADPNTTLISGVTSADRIFKIFAYSELKDLASDQSTGAAARRTALFGDQKTALNLWTFFVRESLLLLGEDYQLFLRRGQPPQPTPPASISPSPKIVPDPRIGTPARLLRQSIFKTMEGSPVQAALDALSSDGPIVKAFETGADATHVPELFRSVETKFFSSPIAEETKKNVQSAKGLGSRLKGAVLSYPKAAWTKYAPERLRQSLVRLLKWWTQQRTNKIVEASLPYRELDVVVVDVLSHLTSASLTEDRYGTVQRDIPRILEAMVSYLSAIEEYQIEVSALQKPLPANPLSLKDQQEREALSVEIQEAHDVLAFMADGLKEGIARIVHTFGDKLLAFKFPPRIAQKLQAFVDYRP